MFRWLLILTMALLPWHGWAGASQAGAMAVAPAVILASADHGAVSAMAHVDNPGHASADCLDHAGPAASHHAVAGDGAGCAGCSMCHSCSPVGLPAIASLPEGDLATPRRPAGAVSRFASAEPFPGLKPPIS